MKKERNANLGEKSISGLCLEYAQADHALQWLIARKEQFKGSFGPKFNVLIRKREKIERELLRALIGPGYELKIRPYMMEIVKRGNGRKKK